MLIEDERYKVDTVELDFGTKKRRGRREGEVENIYISLTATTLDGWSTALETTLVNILFLETWTKVAVSESRIASPTAES